jgi:hypothetical protein
LSVSFQNHINTCCLHYLTQSDGRKWTTGGTNESSPSGSLGFIYA